MDKIDKLDEKIFDLNLEAMQADMGVGSRYPSILLKIKKLSLLKNRLLKIGKLKIND
jgi:hypothetical protein